MSFYTKSSSKSGRGAILRTDPGLPRISGDHAVQALTVSGLVIKGLL